MNTNDYSILLGVHKFTDNERGEAKRIINNSPNFDLLYMEGIINKVEEDYYRQSSEPDLESL